MTSRRVWYRIGEAVDHVYSESGDVVSDLRDAIKIKNPNTLNHVDAKDMTIKTAINGEALEVDAEIKTVLERGGGTSKDTALYIHYAQPSTASGSTDEQQVKPRVVRIGPNSIAASMTCVSMNTVKKNIPRGNELGVEMPTGRIPSIGKMLAAELIAMHLIPHESVGTPGGAQDVLKEVMHRKIGTGSWQQRAARLIDLLDNVNGLPTDPVVERALLQWRMSLPQWRERQYEEDRVSLHPLFLNEQAWVLAIYVLGRIRRELSDEILKVRTSEFVDADLEDKVELLAQKYELTWNCWRVKEELNDEDFLDAFKCIVDSECNVIRTHRFYETTWDCGFWMPVWDSDDQVYRLWVPNWKPDQLKQMILNNVERLAKFGSTPKQNVTKMEVQRLLMEWFTTLRQMDLATITFPPRISRTILTSWGNAVLAATDVDGHEIHVDPRSPLLSVPAANRPQGRSRRSRSRSSRRQLT